METEKTRMLRKAMYESKLCRKLKIDTNQGLAKFITLESGSIIPPQNLSSWLSETESKIRVPKKHRPILMRLFGNQAKLIFNF